MENCVGSAIEKIKILEQDKEAKLKEKREYDGSVALLQRNVRDILNQIEKISEEQKMLNDNNSKLISQLKVEQIRGKALTDQAEALQAELKKLKNKVINDISNVWKIRSSFCETVQKTSDGYSVWALLMKPVVNNNYAEYDKPKHISCTKQVENELLANGNKLQAAIARRNNAMEKRNFLLTEPEKGEEFLRIKNALRYSLEKMSSLKT